MKKLNLNIFPLKSTSKCKQKSIYLHISIRFPTDKEPNNNKSLLEQQLIQCSEVKCFPNTPACSQLNGKQTNKNASVLTAPHVPGKGCSLQMNWGNCEKRTSLVTSACKCSEHSAFESMWLSTNVNDSALGWMEYWHCQVWHPELTLGTICMLETFFCSWWTLKCRDTWRKSTR